MNIFQFIREKVAEHGSSQSAVARKCGISQALVNKMMYEEYRVQLETIKKIASAYNIPYVYFLEDTPPSDCHPTVFAEGLSIYKYKTEIQLIHEATKQLPEDEQRILHAYRTFNQNTKSRKLEDFEELAGLTKEDDSKKPKPLGADSNLSGKKNVHHFS